MPNHQNRPLSQREVITEDRVRVAGRQKAPDYGVQLDGRFRFYIEAKKPAVNLHDDPAPAVQVRTYAWNKGIPLSFLTDFEELALYDCRANPNARATAATARLDYLRFDTYLARFDELWDLLARETVADGSLDRRAAAVPERRGTETVDVAFLNTLEQMRADLAQDLIRQNPKLDVDGLRYLVQMLLDRIVFLRIAEDREVEPYGDLEKLAADRKKETPGQLYGELLDRFRAAVTRYNSGLFDLSADTLSSAVTLSNDVVRGLLRGLYPPDSNYKFDVIGVDILGSAYERFLGKIIELPAPGRAQIVEKPEVRKAGGVYYTPPYIVRYIVRATLEPLCQGRTPAEVAQLRIVDPACGSGSFLLGAYDYLLDWHQDYYQRHPKAAAPPTAAPRPTPGKARAAAADKAALTSDGRLSTTTRKAILLNNLYGVDLDAQAVEVTKLSLLLKCLEGETRNSAAQQLGIERLLPTIDHNVKVGNSLVDPDFYDEFEFEATTDNLRPFSWRDEFKAIFKQGGFDGVIGNPPYVRSQFISEAVKTYFARTYPAASYQPDTFAFFISKAVMLLKDGGRFGYIIPSALLTNKYYQPLRELVLDRTRLEQVIDLKSGIFKDAAVDTIILLAAREDSAAKRAAHNVIIGTDAAARFSGVVTTPSMRIKQAVLRSGPGAFYNTANDTASFDLATRVRKANPVALGSVVEVKAGMKVRKDFVRGKKETSFYKKFLMGSDVKPNYTTWKGKWVCYDKDLETRFSNQSFRDERIFLAPEKVLVRQVMGKERIYAAVDKSQFYADQSLYLLLPINKAYPATFLAGVIASRLMSFYFSKTMADGKATFPKVKGDQLKQLPLPKFSPKNAAHKQTVVDITKEVDELTKLHQQRAAATVPTQQQQLQRQLTQAERRLDRLVYQLYGLSQPDIDQIVAALG
ncbi:hypothetical protein ACVWYF_004285 [Hymenobacter sp. UYAg731]